MNFAHFCEFSCFSFGKEARFTLNFCSGMPPGKVHELAFLWFGLPGPLLIACNHFDDEGNSGRLHGNLRLALKRTRPTREPESSEPSSTMCLCPWQLGIEIVADRPSHCRAPEACHQRKCHALSQANSLESQSEAWEPPQFQEKRSRSGKVILGALP